MSILAGFGLVLFHVYEWLRYGVWASYKVIQFLQWMGMPWAHSPRDWYGIYDALSGTPLFVALVVLGFVLSTFGGASSRPSDTEQQ